MADRLCCAHSGMALFCSQQQPHGLRAAGACPAFEFCSVLGSSYHRSRPQSTGYRLEGRTDEASLELQRINVWAPAAKVVVHGSQKGAPPTTQRPPDTRYFKGSIAGAPGSAVVLAVDPAGGVNGIATHGQDRWALSRPALSPVAAAAGVAPAGLTSRKAAPSSTASRPPFHCGAADLPPQRAQQAQQASSQDAGARKLLQVRLLFIFVILSQSLGTWHCSMLDATVKRVAAGTRKHRSGLSPVGRSLHHGSQPTAPTSPTHHHHAPMQSAPLTASVAIETDGELWQLLGGTTDAVIRYVGQLVACECPQPATARPSGCLSRGPWVASASCLQPRASVLPFTMQSCTLAAADADLVFAREVGVRLQITWCVPGAGCPAPQAAGSQHVFLLLIPAQHVLCQPHVRSSPALPGLPLPTTSTTVGITTTLHLRDCNCVACAVSCWRQRRHAPTSSTFPAALAGWAFTPAPAPTPGPR